jgi:protein CpxP
MNPLIKFAVIAVLSVGIFGAMAGCAHHFAHKSPQERAEWIVKEINDELKLNDAQLGKLNALKDELLVVRSEYRKRHGDTRKTIDELLSQPTLDQARVLAMIKERTQEVNDKAPQVVAALADFFDSLTAEQKMKLHDEIIKRMKRDHEDWNDE